MKRKTVTIIGSTGLIGSCLLKQLIADDTIEKIKCIVRKESTFIHPKVQVIVIDFSDRVAYKNAILGTDGVFCTVGTTQKKVMGDKEAYRKVDYDIPVTAAELCVETGVSNFLLVSSVGANSNSNNFYLKLKGAVEDAISKSTIPSISIFRPSMLLGTRKEFRLAEKIGQQIMRWISFLIPSNYKAIEATTVARAMVAAFHKNQASNEIYHYREMMEIQK